MAVADRTRLPSNPLVALVGFVPLALMATFARSPLAAFDGPISDRVRGTSLVSVFRDVSLLGATEVAVVLCLVISALLWRRSRPAALLYPGAVFVSGALNVVLKTAIDRPRPPDPATATALASFPSGHAFQVTVVLGLLPVVAGHVGVSPRLVRVIRAVALSGIVAVAASRVYLGAHWTTDVLGGVLVGAAVVLAVERLLARSVRPTPSPSGGARPVAHAPKRSVVSGHG